MVILNETRPIQSIVGEVLDSVLLGTLVKDQNRYFSSRFELLSEESCFKVRGVLPGIDPTQLSVSVKGRLLNIELSVKEAGGGSDGFGELVSPFKETLSLSEPVDYENSTVSFEQGVLTITLPKKEDKTEHLLPIQ